MEGLSFFSSLDSLQLGPASGCGMTFKASAVVLCFWVPHRGAGWHELLRFSPVHLRLKRTHWAWASGYRIGVRYDIIEGVRDDVCISAV